MSSAVTLLSAWCWVQAVPLPEVGGVSEDPGQLPQPDKVTKAYFEVCSLSPLFSLKQVTHHTEEETCRHMSGEQEGGGC